ncbi:MAG: nucleotidyltransferase family protein [Synechococcales bacterium]|nr:nucleotidyltransferase family protein [Synechococcales bacterium]
MVSLNRSIALILLAAGGSQRMGYPKQLLPVQGRSLLRYIANRVCEAPGEAKFVVLGAYHEVLSLELIDLPLEILINDDWDLGMSSSLQTGIAALPNSIAAAMILLCDQPHVSVELIEQLIQQYQQTQAPIVACAYGETVGVPALFDRSLFGELQQLTADEGARSVIQAHRDRLVTIPFPQGAIDLDTLEDWEAFLMESPLEQA